MWFHYKPRSSWNCQNCSSQSNAQDTAAQDKIENFHLPKSSCFGELSSDYHVRRMPHLRYKDILKKELASSETYQWQWIARVSTENNGSKPFTKPVHSWRTSVELVWRKRGRFYKTLVKQENQTYLQSLWQILSIFYGPHQPPAYLHQSKNTLIDLHSWSQADINLN